MASEERRMGTFRRGMTVLGRIPTPSVPKPVNLPSQRFENRGLHSNAENMPRGWETSSASSATGFVNAGAAGSIALPPARSGPWNIGIKNQTSSNEGENLVDRNSLSPATTRTGPSVAATIALINPGINELKMQAPSSAESHDSVVPMSMAENSSQRKEYLFKHSSRADRAVWNSELHSHPGVSANGGDGPGLLSGPKALQYPGDDHMITQRLPSADTRLHTGPATCADFASHEVSFGSFALPCYSNPHNSERLQVRTVNGPSECERHHSHPTTVCSIQSNLYGKHQHQPRIVEDGATSGDHMATGQYCTSDMKVSSFSNCMFPSQEREGICESEEIFHKFRDLQFGKGARYQGYYGLQRDVGADSLRVQQPMAAQGNEWDWSHIDSAGFACLRQEAGGSPVLQLPEKKIRLLTKMPAVEPQKSENANCNSATLLGCGTGSDTLRQETRLSNFEGVSQDSDKNLSKAVCVKRSGNLETTKFGTELTRFINEDRINETTNCIEEGHLTKKTDLTKLSSAHVRSSSATELTKVTNENRNVSAGSEGRTKCVEEEQLTQKNGSKNLSPSGLRSSSFAPRISSKTIKGLRSKSHSKHDGKADAEGLVPKSARQTCQGAIGGGLKPLEDCNASWEASIRLTATEDGEHRSTQKLKAKHVNHKTEKAWIPKFSAFDSVPTVSAFSSDAQEKKSNEIVCSKVTRRGESSQVTTKGGFSQECITGDIVASLGSVSLPNHKAQKLQNIHCLSSSLNLGIHSEKDAFSASVSFNGEQGANDQLAQCQNESDTLKFSRLDSCSPCIVYNDQQSKVTQEPIDQPTEGPNERDSFKDASCTHLHNSPCVRQNLTAMAPTFTKTESPPPHKSDGGQGNCTVVKGKQSRSPAAEVEVLTACVLENKTNKGNISLLPSPENLMDGNPESKTMEQENPLLLDTYDYDGQRARLKEIAAQRAKQRCKEQEDRARDQKAKALAKLEELDRRTMASSRNVAVNEHAGVLINETSNKKKTKRLASSRRPPAIVWIHDLVTNDLEDKVLSQDSHKAASCVLPTVGNKQVATVQETVTCNSSNKRSELDSIDILGNDYVMDSKGYNLQEPINKSCNQGQLRIGEESTVVLSTRLGLSSVENYEMKKHNGTTLEQHQMQKGGTFYHENRGLTLNSGPGRGSVVDSVEEQIESPSAEERKDFRLPTEYSELFVSAPKESNTRSTKVADESGRLEAAERNARKGNSLHFYAPEENGGLPLSGMYTRQSHQTPGGTLQEEGNKTELDFPVKQAQSPENSEPSQCITEFGLDILSEKVGQLQLSQKQQNLRGHQFQLNGYYKPKSGVKNDNKNVLEESLTAPAQFRKSKKPKNARKKLNSGQKGLLELEGCAGDGRTTDTDGHVEVEPAKLSAAFNIKHDAEANAIECINDELSSDLWWSHEMCQKGGDERKPKSRNSTHWRAAGELHDEGSDAAISLPSPHTSYEHSFRKNAKANRMSQLHKSNSAKLTDTVASHDEQASSHDVWEDSTFVWHRAGSIAQRECEQDVKNSSALQPRKLVSRRQPLGTKHYKHTEIDTMDSDSVLYKAPINAREELIDVNTESKTGRWHKAAFQVFKPLDPQYAPDSKHHGGRRLLNGANRVLQPSKRSDKQFSQRKSNGCSTAAEFDQRNAKTATKTEISC